MSKVTVLFYKFRWDIWSVLSVVAQFLKTGKVPQYTHTAVLVGDWVYSLFHDGIYYYAYEGDGIADDTVTFETNVCVKDRIIFLGESGYKPNVPVDFILWMQGKDSVNCISFVRVVCGLDIESMTVDEFRQRCYEL